MFLQNLQHRAFDHGTSGCRTQNARRFFPCAAHGRQIHGRQTHERQLIPVQLNHVNAVFTNSLQHIELRPSPFFCFTAQLVSEVTLVARRDQVA